MENENFSVDLKIRVNPTQDQALEKLAGKRVTKKATIARQAIQEYLARELPGYPDNHQAEGAAVPEPKAKKEPRKRKVARVLLSDVREVSLGIFGAVPAGWPDNLRAAKFVRTVMVTKGRFPEHAFGLDVKGDSMNTARGKFGPVLDGQTVVLLPPELREPKHGDIVAALIDGQTTLKRLDCELGPECVLRAESDNPQWANCMRPAHELLIQGVVVGKL